LPATYEYSPGVGHTCRWASRTRGVAGKEGFAKAEAVLREPPAAAAAAADMLTRFSRRLCARV